jgi:AcrR family transcriptional regulator
MPVTERRERRRLALRDAILDAARTIVAAEGLGALTMRRIADAVDYAPASLYAHFANREALLAEICREGFAALRGALENAVAAAPAEPRARLRALCGAYVGFALAHPATYRLIFMEDTRLTKGVFESTEFDDGQRAFALLLAPLFELRAAGVLRKSADPARLADVLFAVVHGIASLRLACPTLPATPDGDLIAAAVTAVVDGSRPRPRA